MKLCTVIVYYITSITKQFKFLNFHCSIVCSYCSVVCLIAKKWDKNERIFKFFLIKIHLVNGSFNEDAKNMEALILGEGRPEKLGKMGSNRDIYCYSNRRVDNFEREYSPLPPGIKIIVVHQLSYMPDQILAKKRNEKLNFQSKI